MKAPTRWLLVGLAGLLLAAGSLPANAHIYWRVSVKVFLDANGKEPRPDDISEDDWNVTEEVRKAVALYNRTFDDMGMGIHLQLRDVATIGGASEWFDRAARDAANRAWLEAEAKADPGKYIYRTDAINVYLNNTRSGVSGGHLALLGDVIMVGIKGKQGDSDGPQLRDRRWVKTMLHEIGHALSLCHTHGCACMGGCDEPLPGVCHVPEDDLVTDTYEDVACWSIDDLSTYHFGRPYAALDTAQQAKIDRAQRNLMSYHEPQIDVITRGQWQRMISAASRMVQKRPIATGKTVFVDREASVLTPCELVSTIASLVGPLPGPVSWYVDELVRQAPPPESYFGAVCEPFSIDPPFPPEPPGYPAGWPWFPTALFPSAPPPLYPSDWPWPPVDPEPFTVCLGGVYKTIQDAISCAAENGDRLQIRTGSYNERITIAKPVTLAADGGPVHIGQ